MRHITTLIAALIYHLGPPCYHPVVVAWRAR